MHISYTEQAHYDFALQFLQSANMPGLHVQLEPQRLEIEVSNNVLGRLLKRIGEQRSVVLP